MRKGESELKGNFKENGSYLEQRLKELKEKEEKDWVKFNLVGEKSHILFGHGIQKNDVIIYYFEEKEFFMYYEYDFNSFSKETSKPQMN